MQQGEPKAVLVFWAIIAFLAKCFVIFPILACISSLVVTAWVTTNPFYHATQAAMWLVLLFEGWVISAFISPLVVLYCYLYLSLRQHQITDK
jgi:hypothetical protein